MENNKYTPISYDNFRNWCKSEAKNVLNGYTKNSIYYKRTSHVDNKVNLDTYFREICLDAENDKVVLVNKTTMDNFSACRTYIYFSEYNIFTIEEPDEDGNYNKVGFRFYKETGGNIAYIDLIFTKVKTPFLYKEYLDSGTDKFGYYNSCFTLEKLRYKDIPGFRNSLLDDYLKNKTVTIKVSSFSVAFDTGVLKNMELVSTMYNNDLSLKNADSPIPFSLDSEQLKSIYALYDVKTSELAGYRLQYFYDDEDQDSLIVDILKE